MKDETSTKDIYLAAAFITLGATYDGADKSDPRHMIFSFSGDGVDLDEIETQWVNSQLRVNAVHFKNALQQMKAIVHSA